MRFDIFNVFAETGKSQRIPLSHPAAAEDFVGRVNASVKAALRNKAFLEGRRTEAMFGALVASLGSVQLLKEEDAGEIYATDDALRPPDFRLVLTDGKQVLVEVKNFYQGVTPTKDYSMDDAYLEGLSRYARVMGCDLKLAIYWVEWNKWTLTSTSVFETVDKRRVLKMIDAYKFNEMSILGDVLVGTKFPLEMKLVADRTKPRAIDDKGIATFTVGSVELCCAGSPITDAVERRIAGFLMMYGDWSYNEPECKIDKNQVEAVLHKWEPEVDSKQGFEIVGSLSSMFSRFYGLATSSDVGTIEQLKLDVSPGSLGLLIPSNYKGTALPLWRLVVRAQSQDTLPLPA
jgi:hypothetical protein